MTRGGLLPGGVVSFSPGLGFLEAEEMGEGAALPYASSLLACVDNVSRFRAAPCESRTAFLWGFLCLGNGDSA